MTKRTRSSYDAWARTYDRDPNPQTALEFTPVLEALRARPGEEVLDAACGTGRYTLPLHQLGASVIGCDFSREMLAVARERLPEVELVEAVSMNGCLSGTKGSMRCCARKR